jgi:hypothetical protein
LSKGSGSGVIFILFLLPKSSAVSVEAFSVCLGLGLGSILVIAACRILWTGLGVGSASSPLEGTSNTFPLRGDGSEGVFAFGAACVGFSF